ncbi:hypothetical protein, partial [Rossellomorea marisflavi]|uniref:hypothetical protein n=1 Tax=Rossellomorea marisflavi TaxID=189381 RepID=UPI00345DB5E3
YFIDRSPKLSVDFDKKAEVGNKKLKVGRKTPEVENKNEKVGNKWVGGEVKGMGMVKNDWIFYKLRDERAPS